MVHEPTETVHLTKTKPNYLNASIPTYPTPTDPQPIKPTQPFKPHLTKKHLNPIIHQPNPLTDLTNLDSSTKLERVPEIGLNIQVETEQDPVNLTLKGDNDHYAEDTDPGTEGVDKLA